MENNACRSVNSAGVQGLLPLCTLYFKESTRSYILLNYFLDLYDIVDIVEVFFSLQTVDKGSRIDLFYILV